MVESPVRRTLKLAALGVYYLAKMFATNTMSFITGLTCFTFTVASCQAQTSTEAVNKPMPVAIGDTVSALGKNIWIIFQGKNNNYWFGSDGQGIFRYDGNAIVHFSTKDGLLNNQIRGIQEDREGNIFISSLGGVNKFDGQKFITLPVVESTDWQLSADDLWFSILGKSNEYGPYRYDGKTLYHLKFPKSFMEDKYYTEHGKHPWSPYEVYTIYKDKKGNIWFGTVGSGVWKYDGHSVKNFTKENGLESNHIWTIYTSGLGELWFGGANPSGVYKFNGHSFERKY
ncbi:MAG: hypothetical protein EOP49_07005 [Sphingobacteriales bacterium]|nr:MAG: hypothetical protein EOP49_07005 [Sphingobacteriales bacterium]